MSATSTSPGRIAAEYHGSTKSQAFEAWHEELSRRFVPLAAQSLAGDELACEVELSSLSDMALATARGTASSFSRTRHLLADQRDDFVLIRATSGRLELSTCGKTVQLLPEQMCLTQMCTEGTLRLLGDATLTSLRIPRRSLLASAPAAERRLGVLVGDNAAVRQAVAAYAALSADVGQSLDPVGQQRMSQHLVDMVALLLRASDQRVPEEQQGSIAGARLQLLQRDIIQHLTDVDLTIAAVALRQHCHPKQVQRLFAAAGLTFAGFVLEERLLLAKRRLSVPASRTQKICEVAYDVGFHDLAYFNRAFRARFGMTPSEVREAMPDA